MEEEEDRPDQKEAYETGKVKSYIIEARRLVVCPSDFSGINANSYFVDFSELINLLEFFQLVSPQIVSEVRSILTGDFSHRLFRCTPAFSIEGVSVMEEAKKANDILRRLIAELEGGL